MCVFTLVYIHVYVYIYISFNFILQNEWFSGLSFLPFSHFIIDFIGLPY